MLDASAALARLAPDEMLPSSVVAAIESETIVVPALWPFEVANALEVMRRRKRFDEPALADAVVLLESLAPEIEMVSARRCWGAISGLAREQQLTVYDAAYLELAKRRRLPLATLDEALREAACHAQVELA
ncbi:MAG: type II toxin-antitoxin system VapC family toxin [Gammaproteobacteria bacterium]|nr:type II toxin-antitoxin system VapC family toxin [Gammaproteobacteria bacterium]